jgi:hypothetical protein
MSIQQISALARGLKEVDPHDERVRTASFARIDELRTLLSRAGCSELVCCLEAAATLIRMTVDNPGPTTPQLMEVVAKLVEAVDSAFGYESPHVQKVKAMGESGLCLAGSPASNDAPKDAPTTTTTTTPTTNTHKPTPPALDKKRAVGGSLTLSGSPGPKATEPKTTAGGGAKAEGEAKPAMPSMPRRAVASSDQGSGAAPLLNDMVFGELMIQLGHVSREQLNDALDHQAAKGGRLGQALIDQNATSWDVIENVLRFQRMLNPEESHSEQVEESKQAHPNTHREMPSMLGEVVAHLGFTTPEKVQEALRVHKATGIRMGEALVQIGALTWPQLRESLRLQHNMRYAAGHAEVKSPKFGQQVAGK